MSQATVRLALCAPGEIWGGVEQFVETLSAHFVRQGLPVLVIVLYDGPLRERLERTGIPVETVGGRGPYDPKSVLSILKLLRKHRINVLHTHGYKAAVLGSVAARIARVKHVRTEHGRVEPWTGAVRARMAAYAFLERIASRWLTDAIVFVSRDILRQSSGLRRTLRHEVIYNGIDPSCGDESRTLGTPLSDGPDSFNIGVIGRVVPVKGHRYLLEARALLRHLPHLHIHVFGTGPLEDSCRQYCDEQQIADTVHFHGFKTDIHRYMRQLDLLAMPSLHEGMPYTLLEAMYCGTPVVASAVGGLAEVIEDQVTGVLVPPADPAILARAIERLAGDRLFRRTLAINAHQVVRTQFLVDTMATRYFNVYTSVLSN